MNTFLQVNKDYLGLGLKSIDLLVLSQIDEFQRNDCQCYVTNEQFSDMFGESVSTIKRTLDKLERLNIIERKTVTVKGNGRANKVRTLTAKPRREWKVHYEPSITMEVSNDNGRFKSSQWEVHNEPIKDNIKDNIIETGIDENELNFIFNSKPVKEENNLSFLSPEKEYQIYLDYRRYEDIDEIIRIHKIDKDLIWNIIQSQEELLPYA